MKVKILGIVPFLGLLALSANADERWNEVVAVTVQAPQNLAQQGDGSHRLFYQLGKKYFYHPNRERVSERFEANLDMCVMRDVPQEAIRATRARVSDSSRAPYVPESGSVITRSQNFASQLNDTGESVYISKMELRDPQVYDRHFALTCISRRPFNAQVYAEIMGEGITVVPQ